MSTDVAIIGGGLAGTACAYMLRQRGIKSTIYETGAALASGASGNPIGLYNPRISAQRGPESDFYTAAFSLALRSFGNLDDIDWNPCGALHLATDETKQKRFRACAANWGWPDDHMRMVDAQAASEIAGIAIAHEALWISQSGFASPRKLCERMAQGSKVKIINSFSDIDWAAGRPVILAAGIGVKNFPAANFLPLKPVRGQITLATPSDGRAKMLHTNLCYGGYTSMAAGGIHVIGSTFQRWLDHSEVMDQDDHDNITKLEKNVPALKGAFIIAGRRAAIRTVTDDHFPVIGKLPEHERVFVSTAHGSHGILSALLGAQIIADMVTGTSLSVSSAVIEKLSPARYNRA